MTADEGNRKVAELLQDERIAVLTTTADPQVNVATSAAAAGCR
jgi:hypothetical protein